MKSKISIVLVLVGVILLVIIGGVNILNKEKVAINTEEFKSIMENKGFDISDATEQFSSYDYVEKVDIAIAEDKSYQIEFYTLSDTSTANYFYNTNKTIFETSKDGASSNSSKELKNYAKYTLTSGGKYKVVSRIDNTVIYVNVKEEYKDSVKSILKELGY